MKIPFLWPFLLSGIAFGQITDTGYNVGIGTTTPSDRLEVVGDITLQGYNATDDGPLRALKFFNSYTSSNSVLAQIMARRGNGSHQKGDLAFYVKNGASLIEALRVSSNGNIGIGTANPSSKLDIFGSNSNATNLILSANYENSYRWRFKTIDRGNAIDMDITASDASDVQEAVLKLSRSSSARPEFQLYNNAIVANNGNVGIGNATPTEKLHVSGNILGNKLLLKDPNDTSDWNTIWQSGFYQSYNAANAPEANAWFWGLNMNHGSNHTNYRYNGQIAIKNSSTSPTMYFRSTYGGNGTGTWAKVLHSEGDQAISGNLGIGTTNTQGFKLGVQGKIAAEEVKVATYANWPDYVFNSSYNLPTLKEVETHIKEKGHLKGIPNAKEVKSDGFYLAEMNSKLLKKIEELMLYTIAQEKRIEIQNKENESLRNRVEKLENNKQISEALLERVTKLEEKIKSK